MKQYQCVIFDWDGTLMDSEARIVASIQEAARRCDFPVLSDHESKQIIGLSLEKAILGLYPQATLQQVQQMSRAYSQDFLEESEVKMEIFDGAEELLVTLQGTGVKLAIATGKSRRGLDQILAEYSFESYFDMTRTPIESASKPDPLMLKQILGAFDLEVHQAVMVGDTEFDMAMAQAIQMDRIALSHGVHEMERLQRYDPVACFDSLIEMQGWLVPRLETC